MSTASTQPDRPLRGASPLAAYGRFWSRYAVFSGRASLSEYWWTALLQAGVVVLLVVLFTVLRAVSAPLVDDGSSLAALPNGLGAVLGFLLVVFLLASIVPWIAISVRRLHDADLSGLLVLLGLIPSVGGLIVLVLHVLPSNPRGARFDRGATAWAPAVPPAVVPAPLGPPPPASTPQPAPSWNGGLDAWPSPVAPPPATAPLPVSTADESRLEAPEEAVLHAWEAFGAARVLRPRLSAQPSWRRQGYLLVRGRDGIDVLGTTGLGAAEGASALGPGAEVYLAGRDLGDTDDEIAAGWRFPVVAAVALRIGASGMHLPAELEQYGALSMTVAAAAPDGWRTAAGDVGILLGVGLAGAPEAVATAAGEIRLVGVVPLRPEELQRILDGGREARSAVARSLAALPADALVDPDRPAVFTA